MSMLSSNSSIEQGIEDLKSGKLLVLIDDISSPAAAYIIGAAQKITETEICFMLENGGAVITAPITEARAKALGLPDMGTSKSRTTPDFTTSIEARRGVTTGISAADRALTLRTLALTTDSKIDLVMPGHIFPIRSKEGGVLVRHSYPEACTDLLSLADLPQTGAACHCLNEKGDLLAPDEFPALQKKTDLTVISISEVVRKRLVTEPIIEKASEANLPIRDAGNFHAIVFRSKNDDAEHLALVKGEIGSAENPCKEPILVRVQAENRIGDLCNTTTFFNRKNIASAIERINSEERGIFIYIRHPRRGVLAKQVKAFTEKKSFSNMTSQLRQLGIGAQILNSLGARRIHLLTNSERPIPGIEAFGLEIVSRIGLNR